MNRFSTAERARTCKVGCQPHVRRICSDFIITAGGLWKYSISNRRSDSGRSLVRASEVLPVNMTVIPAQASALVKSSCHGRIRGSYRKPNGAKRPVKTTDLMMNDSTRTTVPRISCTSLAEPCREPATCDQEENVDRPLTMWSLPRSLTFANIIAAASAPVGRCGQSKPQIAASQLILFSLSVNKTAARAGTVTDTSEVINR